jgi:hypothetical protein
MGSIGTAASSSVGRSVSATVSMFVAASSEEDEEEEEEEEEATLSSWTGDVRTICTLPA